MAEEQSKAPRDYETLRRRLIDIRHELPRRLAEAAAFALDHPDDVAFGSAAGVAKQAGVPPSTLVRLGQVLGYTGFSDLQSVFRSRLRERWPDYADRLKDLRDGQGLGGPHEIFMGLCDSAELSLMRVRERVEAEALERAVDILSTADTIYLVGQRRAFSVTAYVAYIWAKLGVKSVLIDNVVSLGAEQTAHASERDAILAVSFSTYAPSTVEITAKAHADGVPVVAITDSAFSPVAKNATVWFEVNDAESGAFRAVSGTFVVAMTLAIAAGERRVAVDKTQAKRKRTARPSAAP